MFQEFCFKLAKLCGAISKAYKLVFLKFFCLFTILKVKFV